MISQIYTSVVEELVLLADKGQQEVKHMTRFEEACVRLVPRDGDIRDQRRHRSGRRTDDGYFGRNDGWRTNERYEGYG